MGLIDRSTEASQADSMKDKIGYGSSVCYVVELQEGCWLAATEGDPGRTCRLENASVFDNIHAAGFALSGARGYREFANAEVRRIDQYKICPICEGKGSTEPVIRGGLKILADCKTCHSTGHLSWKTYLRIKAGILMRQERVANGLTLRDRATQLGISPTELSEMEQGLRDYGGPVRST